MTEWLSEYHDLVDAVIKILQLLIIIFGWRFISRDNNKRETRKELRSFISELQKRATQVSELSVSLWLKRRAERILEYNAFSSDNLNDYNKLLQNVTLLGHHITLYKKHFARVASLESELIAFKKAVTGDVDSRLESIDIERIADEKIGAIVVEFGNFSRALERVFFEQVNPET